MKRDSLWIIVAAVCAVLASSCCTTRPLSYTRHQQPSTTEVLADLQISTERITYEYHVTFSNTQFGIKIEELKENAVFEALQSVGSDVLVAPQFRVTKTECPFTTRYDITVIGYPATYVNFRQLPAAERTELRELKEGSAYIIVNKSANGQDVSYDRHVIYGPRKRHCDKDGKQETHPDTKKEVRPDAKKDNRTDAKKDTRPDTKKGKK